MQGFISDLHVDINVSNGKANGLRTMRSLAKNINLKFPDMDYLFIAGDTSNDIRHTKLLLDELNSHLTNCQVYWIAGNHEEYISDKKVISEFKDDLYINNRIIETSDKVIIGWNGWYNYSYKPLSLDNFAIELSKKQYWSDSKYIEQPESDFDKFNARYDELLGMLESESINATDKEVVLLTHFIPHPSFIDSGFDTNWDICNSYMGAHLSYLPNINRVVFGHNHRNSEKEFDGIVYTNVGIGYKHSEWIKPDLIANFNEQLILI